MPRSRKTKKFTRRRNIFGLHEPLLYPIKLEHDEIALGTYLTKYHDIRSTDTVEMSIGTLDEKYPIAACVKGSIEALCIMKEARETRV